MLAKFFYGPSVQAKNVGRPKGNNNKRFVFGLRENPLFRSVGGNPPPPAVGAEDDNRIAIASGDAIVARPDCSGESQLSVARVLAASVGKQQRPTWSIQTPPATEESGGTC